MACIQSSDQEIDRVKESIEKCMQLYMNKRETVSFLSTHCNIQPVITRIVWDRLERENREFFRAYYVRLAVKDQIMEFNRLLALQAEQLMRQSEFVAANANQFDYNRSYTTQQMLTPNGVQAMMQQRPENMNHMYPLTNNRLSIQESAQQAFDQSILPQNMFVSQTPNMVSDFDFEIPSNFMSTNPPMGDTSMPLSGNRSEQFEDYLASLIFLEQHRPASARQYPVNSISTSGLSLSNNGQYLDELLSNNMVWEQHPPISTRRHPSDSSSCTGDEEILDNGSAGSLRNPFFGQ
ncbi:hypothetical protein CASFOL_040181 [Castilleja foliolosa]|uniref:Angiotensin-converting enzyme 2 n=1 Tax=Castilleja foliolosa TaxID=1961234 RepID=A0ABD3BGF7_9LAMI